MIVTFSGLDGAGKTTQINRLVRRLELNGIKNKYLWIRGGYTPFFECLKHFIRLLAMRRLPPPGNSPERQNIISRSWVIKLWLNIAIFDLIIFWGISARLHSYFGKIVLCDRYLDDTKLDFSRSFPHVKFEDFILWKLLVYIIPEPSHSFVLWVPVSISLKRAKEKNEPFPDDEVTLSWRLSHYLDDTYFPNSANIKIDCSKSIDEIESIIWSVVKKSCDKREIK